MAIQTPQPDSPNPSLDPSPPQQSGQGQAKQGQTSAGTTTQKSDRGPLEEIANRAATAGGGLRAAAFAVGLQDHQRLLDWNARMRTLGSQLGLGALNARQELPSDSAEDDEEMGDISVTGDQVFHLHNSEQSQELEAPAKQGGGGGGMREWLPWILLAAGAGWAGHNYISLSEPDSAPVQATSEGNREAGSYTVPTLGISTGDLP